MNGRTPASWTDQLWRAVVTLLAAAFGVYVTYRLFAVTWPFLLVLAVLVLVIRLAVGALGGRSRW